MTNQKVNEMYVCGLPYDKVVEILTCYKETGHYEKDYIEGFKDGVNKAYAEFQKIQEDLIKNMTYGQK